MDQWLLWSIATIFHTIRDAILKLNHIITQLTTSSMRQSLMLEGLKRSELNAAKRSKRRDVGRKYDLLHQSTCEEEVDLIHSRQQK